MALLRQSRPAPYDSLNKISHQRQRSLTIVILQLTVSESCRSSPFLAGILSCYWKNCCFPENVVAAKACFVAHRLYTILFRFPQSIMRRFGQHKEELCTASSTGSQILKLVNGKTYLPFIVKYMGTSNFEDLGTFQKLYHLPFSFWSMFSCFIQLILGETLCIILDDHMANMSKGQLLGLFITLGVVTFIISKTVLAYFLYWRWSRNRVYQETMTGGKMVLFKSSGKSSVTSETLLKKTLSLTNKDIIGTGGYGTVYKLVIDEHTAFAIKRLTRNSIDQQRGFERELDAMGDIKHRNVVTLRGYYSSSHVNLLVYDLMQNGSLDGILHSRSPNKVSLDWAARHKIALGSARGIAYLHHDCIPHIIHRDIKSSNILLDEEMEARISDFGLATLINPDQTHVSTIVAGTFGYLAPEYVETGRATEKGDVYSYGVVLLELITGKRPTDEAFVEKGNNIVTWIRALVEDGCEEHAFDPDLVNVLTRQEMKEAFIVAYNCLNQNPSERPTMAQVVKMLEEIKLDASSNQKEVG